MLPPRQRIVSTTGSDGAPKRRLRCRLDRREGSAITEAWWLSGEYLETCNCEFLCPCLLGPRNARGAAIARPTEGHCDVPLVFHIAHGASGTVSLAGTRVVLAVYTPGAMGDGNWRVALYLDASAGEEQRAALERIFTGRAGGVMARVSAAVAEWLPTRVMPIEFGLEGRRRRAHIPGVLDIEIEGVEGPVCVASAGCGPRDPGNLPRPWLGLEQRRQERTLRELRLARALSRGVPR